ncbi:MAG: Ada metal-binding domain-containing protein [Candidatus Velthaea sp.]
MQKTFTLIGRDGEPHASQERGTFGGYRRGSKRIYGRLDCKNALSWIAKGHYAKFRVFFADEATAIAAGFAPCGKCMRAEYAEMRRKAGRASR